jgi:hypothetical protein
MARERGEPAARIDPGATFASTRVGGPRRRPPIAVVGLVVAAGALVAIGIGGRGLVGGAGAGSSARPTRGAVATAAGPPSASPTETGTPGSPRPVTGPEMTSAPGLIELVARRQVNSVFVHGDVFIDRVTWVYVSLRSAGGEIAGWASVSAPGGAQPRGSGGPSLRFDVELAAAYDSFPGPLTLVAAAYDDSGEQVASASIPGLAVDLAPSVVRPLRGAPAETIQPDLRTRNGWPPSRSAGDALVPVRLTEPAAAVTSVTTGSIAVAGTLRIKAARIRISLQTPDHEVLSEASVDTTDPNGGIRPVRTPSFDVRLQIPSPRPISARLVVVVTAYDAGGALLGMVRRTVEVE